MVVAFVQVESAQDRVFRHTWTEMSLDDILAEGGRPKRKPFHDDGYTPEGRYRFWCAADRPTTYNNFKTAPVYRTEALELDADCEECGISIRELAESLTEALG